MRYVDPRETQPGLELVNAQPYYVEEEYQVLELATEYWDVREFPHQPFIEEANPLMLLGPQPGLPSQGRQPMNAQSGPCFDCGGDHLARDCPRKMQSSGPPLPRFSPIERYCPGCCVDHFPKDCKNKLPDKAGSTSRTSLNFIEVIPSPPTSEGETDKISLKVVTRAQAKIDAQVQTDESGDSAKPARKRKTRRKVRSKKAESVKNDSKEEREQTGKKQKSADEPHPSAKEQMLTSSGTSSGGSVIVDKVYEPLQAALDAYNSRIAALVELPKKLQEYPNPGEEKVRLVVYQQIIKDSQTLMDGPPPAITRGPISRKPNLETIPEGTSSLERSSTIALDPSPEEE